MILPRCSVHLICNPLLDKAALLQLLQLERDASSPWAALGQDEGDAVRSPTLWHHVKAAVTVPDIDTQCQGEI